MKNFFLVLFILPCTLAFSQKKVECKKREITVDNLKIADYDGKGGILNPDRRIWLLSPETKDTLLIINPIISDFGNPLFQTGIFYKLSFNNSDKTVCYVKSPDGWGAVGEKKIVSLFFNDKTPLVIENGKLSNEGIAAFKNTIVFNMDGLNKSVQQVNDSIKALDKIVVQRDKSQVALQEAISTKNYIAKLYLVDSYEAAQKIAITQGGVQVGAYEKEIVGGSFAKGTYSFYKMVKPMQIGGKTITFLPIAVSETSPGITSTVTVNAISIRVLGSNTVIKIPAAAYDMAGAGMIKALIDNGIL